MSLRAAVDRRRQRKGKFVCRQFFINLPIADLQKPIALFTALGSAPNPQFTSDADECFVVSDAITFMLLTQ